MDYFNSIGGVLLTLAAFFGLGWGMHAFFHRREHDALKTKVSVLESDLEVAKQDKNVIVNVKALEPEDIESLELSDDESSLLIQITEDGDCGPAEGMSWNGQMLAGARLFEKGLIEETQDGTFATRIGLEWLAHNELLK